MYQRRHIRSYSAKPVKNSIINNYFDESIKTNAHSIQPYETNVKSNNSTNQEIDSDTECTSNYNSNSSNSNTSDSSFSNISENNSIHKESGSGIQLKKTDIICEHQPFVSEKSSGFIQHINNKSRKIILIPKLNLKNQQEKQKPQKYEDNDKTLKSQVFNKLLSKLPALNSTQNEKYQTNLEKKYNRPSPMNKTQQILILRNRNELLDQNDRDLDEFKKKIATKQNMLFSSNNLKYKITTNSSTVELNSKTQSQQQQKMRSLSQFGRKNNLHIKKYIQQQAIDINYTELVTPKKFNQLYQFNFNNL